MHCVNGINSVLRPVSLILHGIQLQDEPSIRVSIHRYKPPAAAQSASGQQGFQRQACNDVVAVEEPLEIRIAFGPAGQRRSKSLAITMRTPGHDAELATGFLLSENVIQTASQIEKIAHVGPAPEQGTHGNTLMVDLDPSVEFSVDQLQRHFYMTSSCGVCGKASIEAVMAQGFQPAVQTIQLDAQTIANLPSSLRTQQTVFDVTGGLHAAGLFDSQGNLIALREDVGRHNAVDKLVGHSISCSEPSRKANQSDNRKQIDSQAGRILVVSGRASFELVQKALTASFEVLIAVGAPSSLAVELADKFNLTLIGFASKKKFNVYCGLDRVRFRDTKSS